MKDSRATFSGEPRRGTRADHGSEGLYLSKLVRVFRLTQLQGQFINILAIYLERVRLYSPFVAATSLCHTAKT